MTAETNGQEFYQRSRTSSGITVLTERMDTVRSVALGLWVATGSRDERPDEAGISHFLEHMMFKGTPTRTAQEISQEFDRMGAEVNAFTSKEYTCYYFRAVDQHLEDGFGVLADMFLNSSMADDAVASERKVVLEEIARRDDAPDDLVHEVLSDALWPDHPVGRPVLGQRDSVAGFGPDDLRRYVGRRHRAGNVVVAASGHVDHDAVVALAEKGLPLADGSRDDRGAREVAIGPRVSVTTKATEQSHVCIGTPGLHAAHEDRFILAVLDSVLGGGMSSRLFQEIREKRGLAYAVFSYHAQYLDTGAYAVYAGTSPENTEKVVRLALDEIAKAVQDGVTSDELHRAKESIKGQLVLGLESTNSRMVRLGKSEVTHGELLSIDDLVERIEDVTQDDIVRVARDTLGGPKVLAAVGPLDEERLARLLD